MGLIKGLIARMRSLAGGDVRMEEEFRFHVEMEEGRLIATGLDPVEARRRALVAFGGLDSHREAMRDGRGARWFEDLGADVRYAFRAMRRSPGFAIAVALTLGIGVGTNGIVFGSVNSLLFRALPVDDPGAVVGMYSLDTKTGSTQPIGYQDLMDFAGKSGAFDGMAGSAGNPLNLVVPWRQAAADMVWGEVVTENFFSVLRMRPALGHLFTAADGPQGANPYAVLSHESWRRRFGGDSTIIGRRVRINGTEFTIIGVAPRGFKGLRTFGYWPEIWVPAGMHRIAIPGSAGYLTGRGPGQLIAVGRMRPGATLEQTERAAKQFAAQLSQTYAATNANASVMVVPGRNGFDNPAFVNPAIIVLSSALGVFAAFLTLVIICANLANLQLARAAARIHEVAIRLSLGCSRHRLMRQMLVESAVFALPGVLLALAICLRGTAFVESSMVPKLQFKVGMGAEADGRVIAFTAVLGIIAMILFGLIPAIRASSTRSLTNLIGGRRTATGSSRTRSVLVVSQLAMSVVLLVGASLFVRSLVVARNADLGFDPSNRVLMSTNIGLQGYDEARGRAFYDQVIARLRADPNVVSAAWVFPVPFDTYDRSAALFIDGVTRGNRDGSATFLSSLVSDGFIDALGLRLETGRDFTFADSTGVPRVMIVSRQLANRLWPGKDPIGQQAKINGPQGQDITVIGVVANAKFTVIGEQNQMRVYIPLRQRYRDWQSLVVHTRGDPVAGIGDVKRIVAAVDPTLPVFGASTLSIGVTNGFSTSRTAATIAGTFGLIALIISAIGLYAVVASGVSERTREIGVRIALGSTPGSVMRYVMFGGAKLGLVGVVIGLAGAAGVARTMSSLLFGLSPSDPLTFIGVPLVLGFVVILATWVPARRAVGLDPINALRSE
jgi:predicted permease